jgi:hypothetical protein
MSTIEIPRIPTGEYAIIIPHGRQKAANGQAAHHHHHSASAQPWWLAPGAIIWAGIVGIIVAVLVGVIYALSTRFFPDDSPVRISLVAVAMSLLIVSMVGVLLGLAVRIVGHRDSLRHGQLLTQLQALEEIIGRKAALQQQLLTRLDQLGGRVEQIAEAVAGRLDRLEREVEERDEEYERGWVDGAAKTADALSATNGNGQVHHLRPGPAVSPPARRPR